MALRSLVCVALFAFCPASEGSDLQTPAWRELERALFGERKVSFGPHGIVELSAPSRADDGAVVPIAIRAGTAQSEGRAVRRLYLIVDNNPSPVAATVEFGRDNGRADLETRLRVEQYSYVRAVAELSDGTLAGDARFVKASGGCSAAATREAAAPLGRMRLSIDREGDYQQPTRAQLIISHPNHTGLAMDQITRLYTPAHYVRSIRVSYAGNIVFSAEVNFSLSEDPYLRFFFVPTQPGELRAQVTDTQDRVFEASAAVLRGASRVDASAIR